MIGLVSSAFVLAACAGAGGPQAGPAAGGGHGHGHGHGEPAADAPQHARGHHHRFDDAASWSKVFDDPARDAWQKPARVVELLGLEKGMTVADVGAGTGYFEPYLSRAVGPEGRVLAVDLEPDMVKWLDERARREGLANVRAVQADAADPKLPDGAVDRILVVDTWHHIDDRAAYARKLARALKPGGAVTIVDFTKESPHGPPPRARLSPEEVMGDLRGGGLEPTVIAGASLPHQFVVTGRRSN